MLTQAFVRPSLTARRGAVCRVGLLARTGSEDVGNLRPEERGILVDLMKLLHH